MHDYSSFCAIKEKNKAITYSEVFLKSIKVANRFSRVNLKKIGIMLSSSSKCICSIIGVLLSKNIFVPLDPSMPIERLKKQINNILDYVIVDSYTENLLDKCFVKKSVIKVYYESFAQISQNFFKKKHYSPDDPVYIYFTSGSTGEPKSIVGKNDSLCHFINWEVNEFKFNGSYVFSQITNICFDPFLREVFVPLSCGASLVVLWNRNMLLSAKMLGKWIEKEKISIIHCTPSVFNLLVTRLNKEEFYLQYILLAGEHPSLNHLKRWYDKYPKANIVNLYGPTETTMAKLYYRIPQNCSFEELIPVGKPLPEVKVYICKKNNFNEICDDDEIGEIYIESRYLTYGYLDKKMNQGCFFKSPYDKKRFVFKTNDFGKKDANGNVILIGRAKNFLKLGGIRMDIGEIRNALFQCAVLDDAAVLCHNNKIYAFVVSKNIIDQTTYIIKLKKLLPTVYLPKRIIQLEKIPFNNNGKIDESELIKILEDDK